MDKVPKSNRKPPIATKSRKGVPNKSTKELKEMILAALHESGGVDYLVERANDPKTASAFLTLIGKVLPMTVAGDPNAPMTLSVKWQTE
jgi:hypothetical protein